MVKSGISARGGWNRSVHVATLIIGKINSGKLDLAPDFPLIVCGIGK